MTEHKADIAVVGAGPAGLITGLALAEVGFQTAVIGPSADPRDGRTAALFQASIALLKRLGVWSEIEAAVEPLDGIRLVDATGGLFRAPEVLFDAHEIGEEAFGYNVPNAVLTAALERLAQARLQRVISEGVSDVAIAVDGVTLTTREGNRFEAALAAAADGRQSVCRAAAGIETRSWRYEQSALVCTLRHGRPHNRISTEFHRNAGPLTLVPAPGDTSNVVWVETPSECARLAGLGDEAFAGEISRHLHGLLGRVTVASARRVFPLSGQTAKVMGSNRVALIGEAGHVIPPIGAQGLNLSFRDAATLADIVDGARATGADIGGADTLKRYADARRFDVTSRIWTVDLLNRSLISGYAPVHFLRGAGLFALGSFGPLRRHVMREGISPQQSTPKLMQRRA